MTPDDGQWFLTLRDDPDQIPVPLILMKANGGPHQDHAFVAGWEMGELWGILRYLQPDEWQAEILTASLPQADLLAMRCWYTMSHLPLRKEEGWSMVTFTKSTRLPIGAVLRE